ncbi:MAG: MFS transporter [Microthrixaceae bacterium]
MGRHRLPGCGRRGADDEWLGRRPLRPAQRLHRLACDLHHGVRAFWRPLRPWPYRQPGCCRGIGGGLLMPVAMSTIYELFAPEERGRAMGYFGIAVMAPPLIGPVLGGGLVESTS